MKKITFGASLLLVILFTLLLTFPVSAQEVGSTEPITSPVGAAITQTIGTSGAPTITLDAPSRVIIPPFVTNWSHRFRITNYTALTTTVVFTAEGDANVQSINVHIDPVESCEYSKNRRYTTCMIDVPPNWYWDITLEYTLNYHGEWEIVQSIGHQQKKTIVIYFLAPIGMYLPQIRAIQVAR